MNMTREEAILILQMWWNWHNGKMPVYPVPTEKFNEALDMAIEALKEQRPHGEWTKLTIYESTCSCCKNVIDRQMFVELPNFCPNCGADMRKEGETREE